MNTTLFGKNQKTQTTPSHAEIQQLDLATREIMGIFKGDLNSLAGIKKHTTIMQLISDSSINQYLLDTTAH